MALRNEKTRTWIKKDTRFLGGPLVTKVQRPRLFIGISGVLGADINWEEKTT